MSYLFSAPPSSNPFEVLLLRIMENPSGAKLSQGTYATLQGLSGQFWNGLLGRCLGAFGDDNASGPSFVRLGLDPNVLSNDRYISIILNILFISKL